MTVLLISLILGAALVAGGTCFYRKGLRDGDRPLDARVRARLDWTIEGDHLAPTVAIDVRNPAPESILIGADVRELAPWARWLMPASSVAVPAPRRITPVPPTVLGAVDSASDSSWRLPLGPQVASGRWKVAVSVYQGHQRLRVWQFIVSAAMGSAGDDGPSSLPAY